MTHQAVFDISTTMLPVVIHHESVSDMNSICTLKWVGVLSSFHYYLSFPFYLLCLNGYNLLLVFVNGSE